MTPIVRVTQLTVLPPDSEIFDWRAMVVEIMDEAGGEFVEIRQGEDKFRIDKEEWPALRIAVNKMIKACRE